MATDNSPPAAETNKVLWLVIMALALVIVTGAAIGGTYLFVNNPDAEAKAVAAAKAAPPPKPVFVPIKPFTANLQDARGRILYVRVALKVDDDAQATRLTEHMPQVRNRVLLLLADTRADQLTSADGKQMLANKLQVALAQPFAENDSPIGVQDVLFTDFIVQ